MTSMFKIRKEIERVMGVFSKNSIKEISENLIGQLWKGL